MSRAGTIGVVAGACGVTVAMCLGILLVGISLGAGQRVERAVQTTPPPYSPRELADAELSTIEWEATVQFWTQQEEKVQQMLQVMPPPEQASSLERTYINQLAGLMGRALTARQDAMLARERTLKRLEGMRMLNGLPPASSTPR